eukprot:3385744-Karenia_brevis.AAC.1
MAHLLIPHSYLDKVDYPPNNRSKNHKQIFVQDLFTFPIVSAEWYIVAGPDLTRVLGQKKTEIGCLDVLTT